MCIKDPGGGRFPYGNSGLSKVYARIGKNGALTGWNWK
jgi:hypothetical protein